MKKFVFYFILLFLYIPLQGQDRVFPELNCDENRYTLYVFNDFRTVPSKSENFIIDNQDSIRFLVENWQGEKTSDMFLCGYDYYIYVVCDNKIVTRVDYNSECNQVSSRTGIINTEYNPFEKVSREKTFSDYKFESQSRETSKLFLDYTSGLAGVFIPRGYTYRWKDYEGYFLLSIDGDLDKRETEHSFEAFKEKIENKYPDDNFFIDLTYINSESYRNGITYNVNIYCQEDFWEKFDLYEGKFGWDKYSYFDVYVFGDNDAVEELKAKFSSPD